MIRTAAGGVNKRCDEKDLSSGNRRLAIQRFDGNGGMQSALHLYAFNSHI